jgi:tetratricopeptide (TPR) repeat protein
MKTKQLPLITFFLAISTLIYSQKIINTMADDVCKCVEKRLKQDSPQTPMEINQECVQLSFEKYADELIKKYGEELLDSEDNSKAMELGTEIGKVLMEKCDAYRELIKGYAISKQDRAQQEYEKGELLIAEGNLEGAIAQYNYAVSLNPNNAEYLNSRGIARYRNAEYYKAISDFLRTVEVDPYYTIAYYNMAYAKYELYDFKRALPDLMMAIELDPEHCDSYNLIGLIYSNGEFEADSAVYFLEKAIACDTNQGIYYFNLGHEYYMRDSCEAAIDYFREALKKGYDELSIYNALGNCLDKLERYAEAVLYHTRVIEESERDYIPYYNRGLSYYHAGDYEDALADLEMSLKLETGDPDVFMFLGLCYGKVGRFEEAESALSQAIALYPDMAVYYDARAEIYDEMQEYEKSIEDYTVSLAIYPDDCSLHLKLCKLYGYIGNEEKAEAHRAKGLEMGCEED